jgi:hypothetical protein
LAVQILLKLNCDVIDKINVDINNATKIAGTSKWDSQPTYVYLGAIEEAKTAWYDSN